MSRTPIVEGSIYFGYGSNLWLHQMLSLRCPNSTYIGLGRLEGYRWIINQRGYANVVPTCKETELHWNPNRYRECNKDIVYGLVYLLTPNDERILDVNEGAPRIYQKGILKVDFWPSKSTERVDTSLAPERKEMLVYVDANNITDDDPRAEYVWRMNNGIKDALQMGVPQSYVDGVMRPFIPDEPTNTDSETEKLALSQAQDFNGNKDPTSK